MRFFLLVFLKFLHIKNREIMHPRVGVGVILFNEKSEILVGKRKGSHGAGQWALPGGALEWGETSRGCALRETEEEVGIDLLHETTNASGNVFSPPEDDEEKDIFHACECQIDEKNHWITLFALFYVGEGLRGRERTMEPHKCEGWFWKKPSDIDGPTFEPLKKLLESGKLEKLEHPLLSSGRK